MKKDKTHLNRASHGAIPAVTVGLLAVGALTAQASSDYGPAIWRPACSGHWNTSGNGHRFLVVHDMEGYYAYEVSTSGGLRSCSTTVSVHYAVNGKQDASSDYPAGEVTQFVSEAYYAWHARCWNSYSAGCEHEGFRNNPAWYTDAMYNSSSALYRHMADHYGIAKDRNHIVGHDAKSSSAWVSWANANLGINASCNTHDDPGPYWDWTKFMNLINGGAAHFNPAICSRATGKLDVFGLGVDGTTMFFRTWDGAAWNSWTGLGTGFNSGPAATSRSSGTMDVVGRKGDNAYYLNTWNGTSWSGFYSLGGVFASSPAICSRSTGRLDVFGLGIDGTTLFLRSWDGSAWSGWISLGTGFNSAPAATSRSSGTLDVVCRKTDNVYYLNTWNGTSWSGFYSIGGVFASAPAICCRSTGVLDVFGQGIDGTTMFIKTWNGSSWSGWAGIGTGFTSGPGATSRSTGGLDVVGRGGDGACYLNTWNGTSWSGFYSLGGVFQ
jgi:hypothetical protein